MTPCVYVFTSFFCRFIFLLCGPASLSLCAEGALALQGILHKSVLLYIVEVIQTIILLYSDSDSLYIRRINYPASVPVIPAV